MFCSMFFVEGQLRILDIYQNQEAYKKMHIFFVHIVMRQIDMANPVGFTKKRRYNCEVTFIQKQGDT